MSEALTISFFKKTITRLSLTAYKMIMNKGKINPPLIKWVEKGPCGENKNKTKQMVCGRNRMKLFKVRVLISAVGGWDVLHKSALLWHYALKNTVALRSLCRFLSWYYYLAQCFCTVNEYVSAYSWVLSTGNVTQKLLLVSVCLRASWYPSHFFHGWLANTSLGELF